MSSNIPVRTNVQRAVVALFCGNGVRPGPDDLCKDCGVSRADWGSRRQNPDCLPKFGGAHSWDRGTT